MTDPPAHQLTAAQEAFCVAIVGGVPRIAAALSAYPALAGRTKPRSAASEKSRRLLASASVKQRINALKNGAPSVPPAECRTLNARVGPGPTLAELEKIGLIAFDAEQPDVARILALRALTAGLQVFAEHRGSASITLTIAIAGTETGEPVA